MTNAKTPGIVGEHALRDEEGDRLGFSEVADRIAKSIVDRSMRNGLVIGLDGEWGSGKSSLLHLIERSLGKLPEAERPTIINFRPWLIADRDALLKSLFSELADKIAHVHLARGDASATVKHKAQEVAETVRKFGRMLVGAGKLLEAASEFEIPGAKLVARIATLFGSSIAIKSKTPDLSEVKENISKYLRELDHRFIVTIDDVDRLEPKELIEVLRLVRAVADFPNIIYLLC
jgi:predicted KAP-like P-loop ATPase